MMNSKHDKQIAALRALLRSEPWLSEIKPQPSDADMAMLGWQDQIKEEILEKAGTLPIPAGG